MAQWLFCRQKHDKTQAGLANFPLAHFHTTVVARNLALPWGTNLFQSFAGCWML